MQDFKALGAIYAQRMNASQRTKAISEVSTTNKGMVSVQVGVSGATKALIMSQADFTAFKSGFING